MKYIVYYITDNNKRYFERVEASSEKEAERKVRNKYNDVKSIFQISEGW